jgi:hypothetical protein
MDRDVCTIAIANNLNDKSFTIYSSVYMAGDDTNGPPPPIMMELVTYCERNSYDLVIGTDANAHHVVWEALTATAEVTLSLNT